MKKAILFVLLLSVQSFAQQSISVYRNADDFYTGTFESGGELFKGFSAWGYVDLNMHNDADVDGFFFKYQVSKYVYNKLAGEFEVEDVPGSDNYVVRFAATYDIEVPKLKDSSIKVKAYPFGTENSGQKYSAFYKFKLSKAVWIDGFADYYVENRRLAQDKKDDKLFVVEPQVNYALNDVLCLVMEYRHLGYLKKNKNSWAVGLRFILD